MVPYTPDCSPWVLSEDDSARLVGAGYLYLLHLTGCFYMWSLRYSDMPPAAFVGLLDEGRRPEVLKQLKEWWAVWQQLERDALHDMYLHSFLQKLPWMNMVWPREVMIALDEAEFLDVPSDMVAELASVFVSFASTKVVEDGFNVCRDHIRHNKPGRMSRMMRSCVLSTSALLQDSDRRLVRVDAASKVDAPSALHPDSFCARNNTDFSLGDAFLEAFLDEVTLEESAAAYTQQPLMWIWMSAMVEPGTVLYNRSDENKVVGVVVHACANGVLLMKLQLRRCGTRFSFVLPPGALLQIEPAFVHDLADWKACESSAFSPRQPEQSLVPMGSAFTS